MWLIFVVSMVVFVQADSSIEIRFGLVLLASGFLLLAYPVGDFEGTAKFRAGDAERQGERFPESEKGVTPGVGLRK
jgi:hypothetical protein